MVRKNEGVYTVTLESYVTGSKVTQTVEKHIPTDIIVVVDQSGSMAFSMIDEVRYVNYKTIDENLTASRIYDDYSTYETRDNTYVKIGDKYEKVTVARIVVDSTQVTEFEKINTNNNNRYYYSTYEDSGTLYYDDNGTKVKVYVKRERTKDNRFSEDEYKYTYIDEYNNVICTSDDNGAFDRPVDNNNKKIQFYSQTTTTVETYGYTFTYKNASGTEVTHTYGADDVIPTGKENPAVAGGAYYYRTVVSTKPRLTALTDALKNFVGKVDEKTVGKDGKKGTADDVNHRIAIVGFSSDEYSNTEVLTGDNVTITTGSEWHGTSAGSSSYFPTGYVKNGVQFVDENSDNTTGRTNYINATKTALVDVSSQKGDADQNGVYDGLDNVYNAIDALTAYGGTYTDDGTQMALDIWANDTYQLAEGEQRNRVVIVFTDGTPGLYSSNFDYTVATNAIADTKVMKASVPKEGETHTGYGATVYTVGIFDDANGTVVVTDGGDKAYIESTLDANEFMHYMSNNYKNAESWNTPNDPTFHQEGNPKKYTGKSYYLSAGDSEALNNIFQTISEDVENESQVYELDETTVIKDIVAPNFSVPANATNVKVYTAATNGMTGTAPTFASRVDVSDKVTISIDGTDVNVKGFDFAENWVGTETASDGKVTYHGKELIIEFDIPVDPDFIGGNKVKTNGDDSGIYVPVLDEEGNPTGEFELVENFTRPTVDIELKNITAQWQDQNIYRTNNADIKALFTAATINGKEAATVINGENNAYVDIVFTITGPSGELAKYTVAAGEPFADGGWNDESLLTPVLAADTEYTLSWTVTPIHEGTCSEVSGSAKAWVYVYKPVVVFKDSTDYLGDTLTYGSGVNYIDNSEAWKHGDTLSTDVTMSGTKPTVTVTYEQNPQGTENGIIITTNDIPVQATVTITNENNVVITGVEGTHYTVVHAQCDDSDCTYRSDAKEEFVVHVNPVSLNVSKEVTGSTNTSGEFTVTVAFEDAFADKNFSEDIAVKVGDTSAILSVVNGIGTLKTTEGEVLKVTLRHNQTVKLTNLPVGRYTVTENDYSARYNTTVTGGTMVSKRSAYTDLASSKVEDSIKFVNELKAGYLTIKKVIEMPKGFVASTTDEFTIVVKQGDTQFASVTLKNGETCSPIELVAGTYTVVETVKGTLYGDHASQNHTVTIEAGETTSTTVINPAKTGSLEVSKTVVNEAVNYNSDNNTFAVKVKVDGYTGSTLVYKLGSDVKSATIGEDGYATITLANDQSALFENLLANVTYDVIEDLTAEQQAIYKEPVITNKTSTIVAGSTQEATITNTVKTGTLVIDKEISLPEGVSVANDETFKFAVTGPNGYSTDVTITRDGEQTISNLLVGEYTVEENLTSSQQPIYTTSYSTDGGEAIVTDGASTTVTVTNTVTAGKLEVTKTVVDKAENISPDEKFTMEITLAGDIVIEKLIGTVGNIATTVEVTNGKATVELANGQVASFTNIPVGVTYTVKETGVDEKYYTVDYSNENGTITNATPRVIVTNTRNYGKLTITKVIKDEDGKIISPNPGESFLFNVTNADDFDMQVVIAPVAGEAESYSVTLSNLPLGDYTVTEDTSWSYKYDPEKSTVTANTKVTTTEDGQATITNVPKTDKWLKADAYAENVFDPYTATSATMN